jgi:hypothetical protein
MHLFRALRALALRVASVPDRGSIQMISERVQAVRRAVPSSAWLAVWGLALHGVLNVVRVHVDWEHGICGPWGCGPPPQALAACHLFWLVLLTPSVLFFGTRLPRFVAQRVAWILAGLGILGLAAVAFHEFTTWLPQADDWHRRYFVHRCAFTAATLIEIPMAEFLVLGLAMWVMARARRPSLVPADRVSGRSRSSSTPFQQQHRADNR